ncbi:hypothetical protein LX36DRAFT_660139 [Colletotrichum falcatum]|nr:hypothetical protein LX36DRAFT_660139 [Colletotrichum falcatum]
MVQLTVTPSIADGLQRLAEARCCRDKSDASKPDKAAQESISDGPATSVPTANAKDPTLQRPAVGNPVTHGQVLDLWRDLKSEGIDGFSLEGLLRGACVYIPAPPPKPEPSAEYKALMARLRREEEERTYQRMMKQPSRMDNSSRQFPGAASSARAFAEVNRPMRESDNGDDEVTLGDVQKQVMVIFNFLVSIVGVAATIWIAARWWNLTARILLTLAGSIIVLVAEVTLYSGYVWRMTEAKTNRKEPEEVKEVMQTWVLSEDGSGGKQGEDVTVLLNTKIPDTDEGIRRRLKDVS